MTVGEAYAVCQRLARSHYENFPVASHLLPRHMRRHVVAIYAFARTADDFADEGSLVAEDRLARLDDWLVRLRACAGSGPAAPAWSRNESSLLRHPGDLSRRGPGTMVGAKAEIRDPSSDARSGGNDADAIFVALANTIRECALPVGLFEDLLSAFRQDVTTTRYESWTDLLDYCRRSANPVGRLVLRVAGHTNEELDRASDALCTALQLTNFWQDVERDWLKGRLYVPLSDLRAFGAPTDDLEKRLFTASWRNVLSQMTDRTRVLFDEGRRVCDGVSGRLRFELRMTWLGGRRILDALERNAFDVFSKRPALAAGDVVGMAWRALAWKASSR